MGTYTPNFNLYKPSVGETGWGALVDANFDTIDANLTNGLPRAYLAGLQTTLNGGTASTVISIAAGDAQDVGNAGAIRLSSAITKNLNAAWSVGSGNGGLATSLTLLASTWYHLFLIKRTDTGVVDAYFDTSVTAANIPAPYTLYRRISSHRTDTNKIILEYVQDGDYFRWLKSNAALTPDLNVTNPGTSAGTVTCTVPTGVTVQAVANAMVTIGAAVPGVYLSDIAAYDEAPLVFGAAPAVPGATFFANGAAGTNVAQQVQIRTSTLAQFRYRLSFSDANTKIGVITLGWFDARGKNG